MKEGRTNRTNGLERCLEAWDDAGHPLNGEALQLGRTAAGNVNFNGELGDYRGYMLPRHHRQFLESLEAGVRALVLEINARGWVTYSSCEGHWYGDAGVAPVERYVGVVARDGAEKAAVAGVFGRIREVLETGEEQPIHLTVETLAVESGEGRWDAVEVWFRRDARASWPAYFRYLDEFCEAAVALLRDAAVREGATREG